MLMNTATHEASHELQKLVDAGVRFSLALEHNGWFAVRDRDLPQQSVRCELQSHFRARRCLSAEAHPVWVVDRQRTELEDIRSDRRSGRSRCSSQAAI